MSTDIWRAHYKNVESWVEETIWGHRVYDQATPELILLELLNVVSSVKRSGQLPFSPTDSTAPPAIAYRRSLVLRMLLFNNPNLADPLLTDMSEDDRWNRHAADLLAVWNNLPLTDAQHSSYSITAPDHFMYLRDRFSGYPTYVRLISVLRESAIEFNSNKRWTSQFLFPYCDRALFEDLNENRFSTDRRFFGRTGELAYLMLSRSGHGDAIWERLSKILFSESSPHIQRWNTVIRALMHPKDDEVATTESGTDPARLGYLPYDDHQVFQRLGEDVIALLSIGMPEYDAIPYLANLVAFHLMHYVITVAIEGLQEVEKPLYVLEIKGRKNDIVRRLAKRQYQVNDAVTLQRVKQELESLRASQDVERYFADANLYGLKAWLDSKCWRKASVTDAHFSVEAKQREMGKLWKGFEEAVVKKHQQHLARVHHEFARQCGFASRIGTNAYRYAPSDEFLRMIILTNVEDRMEYRQFLDRLYERYGMVISKRHATDLGLQLDLSAFDDNEERLRQRLANLGLLRILSDDCAYVVNRYREGGIR